MKALKVFITIILGIVMTVLVVTFGVLTAGRILLSGNNISNITKDVVKESGELNFGEFIDKDSTITSNELTEAISKMEEYGIDVDEVYEQFGDFTSQVLKYSIGATDEINTKAVKKAAKKAAEKYEAKTGDHIDVEEMEEGIDNAVKEIKQEMKQQRKENRTAYDILGFIFDNKTYFGILFGIIAIAVIIVLINTSIVPLCISTIVISIFGMIGNIALFVLTKFIPTEGDLMFEIVMKHMANIFIGIAVAFLVLLIISIVLIVISKNKKHPITTG